MTKKPERKFRLFCCCFFGGAGIDVNLDVVLLHTYGMLWMCGAWIPRVAAALPALP
jgi:hypothetical protein